MIDSMGGDSGHSSPFKDGQVPTRAMVAQYLMENGDRIRAIARRKLTTRTKSVFDSEDVLSSVLRCLDALASRGGLLVQTEEELWALVATVTRNNAVNRTRL